MSGPIDLPAGADLGDPDLYLDERRFAGRR